MEKRALLSALACIAILVAGGMIRHATIGSDKTKTPKPATIAPAGTVAARGQMTVDGQRADVQGSCFAPADGTGLNITLAGNSPNKVNVT